MRAISTFKEGAILRCWVCTRCGHMWSTSSSSCDSCPICQAGCAYVRLQPVWWNDDIREMLQAQVKIINAMRAHLDAMWTELFERYIDAPEAKGGLSV